MPDSSIDTVLRRPALLPPRADGRGGLLWCAVGVFGFSLTLVATRAAVPELGGAFVGAARSVLAGILAALVLAVRRQAFPRGALLRLWLVALGVVFGFPLTTAIALRTVPASHATVLIGLVPMATAVYAILRNRERPAPEFWVAAVAGAVGVLLFARTQTALSVSGADAWLLAAVACAALGYTEGALLARELGGVTVISWALVLALPVNVAIAAYDWPSRPLASVSNAALLGLGYVSLVSMYLAMVAWYRGLSLGSVARGSQIQLVQPVLGLFWAWALLGEAVAGTTLLAACFVVLCAVRARRARIAVARP
jgi:drug/metabolite transporter (DMT)-like permease